MRHIAPILSSAIVFATAFLLSPSHATPPKEWDGEFAPTKTSYLMYSGSLSEKEPPKPGKQKLSLLIEGQLAQEMFDAIGPDQKQACGASTGVRIRSRGDVTCSFDREIKSPYTCYIGIDFKTGKSIQGSYC